MSGQKEDNPKEIEGEVLEQALNIETVAELKREKAAKKTAFTKVRRCLLTIIQREDVDSQEIKDICEELDIALENVMSAMDKLFDRYKIEKDNRAAERLGDEIEQIEIEYSSAQNRAQKVMDSLSLLRKYDQSFWTRSNKRKQKYHCTKWNLNSLIKKKCFNNSSQCSRKIPKSFFL